MAASNVVDTVCTEAEAKPTRPSRLEQSAMPVSDESSASLDTSFFGSPGYQPFKLPDSSRNVADEKTDVQDLNNLLRSRDYSPVRYCLKSKWSDASERTKREHLRKLEQGVQAVMQSIVPGQEDEVLKDLIKRLSKDTSSSKHDESMQALVAAYGLAEDKATKLQILSIIVDLFTHPQIKEFLPEVTDYQLEQAKKHLLSHGRGQPLPVVKKYRVGVTMPKINHFIEFISNPHFVQDVAYGTRKLKLTSGEIISMPNVVRNIISARIIKQYISYSKETRFQCLGERELYMVLQNCPAQQKKALQGLDNISADGLRSVEKLQDSVRKLGERGKDSVWVNKVTNNLTRYKRYLKGSYRPNISTSSRCADHCSVFALSDPSNDEFSGTCDHPHDMECIECGQFEQLTQLINESFDDPKVSFYSSEEKEDMMHDVKTYVDAIRAWKCHLLRAVNQDISRQDALEKWLKDSRKLFITQDFAMKFLPRRFKETQMEWFGKRGISWHISYCVRKLPQQDEYEVTVYSHIFCQTISQNSEVVAAVMRHTLEEEKKKNQEINEAYYRSDCAGAYASGDVLIPIRQMKALTGVAVSRYDFSEPQAGKGSCDRSSAHQKSHVNRYLNEGHDVMSAVDIKQALESHGGIQGVVPYVVEIGPSNNPAIPKIPGISLLHNFEYSEEGIRVWKAYQVGVGKLLKWKNLDKEGQCLPQSLSVVGEGYSGKKSFVFSTKEKSTKDDRESTRQPAHDNKSDDSGLFACPEPGCVKQYITLGRLEKHMAAGAHEIQGRNEPLKDSIKRKWKQTFEKADCGIPSRLADSLSLLHLSEDTCGTLTKGWALKKPKQSARFPNKVKNYLQEKFQIGVVTGHKQDPVQVATDMRCTRDEQGHRVFSASESLQVQQIRGFFSRMAAAQKRGVSDPSTMTETEVEDVTSDILAQEYEQNIQDLGSEVMENSMERHPVMFDKYNLCMISKEGKLKKKFSIPMLVKICEHFELDITNTSRSRKADLVSKVSELLDSCSCRIQGE